MKRIPYASCGEVQCSVIEIKQPSATTVPVLLIGGKDFDPTWPVRGHHTLTSGAFEKELLVQFVGFCWALLLFITSFWGSPKILSGSFLDFLAHVHSHAMDDHQRAF